MNKTNPIAYLKKNISKRDRDNILYADPYHGETSIMNEILRNLDQIKDEVFYKVGERAYLSGNHDGEEEEHALKKFNKKIKNTKFETTLNKYIFDKGYKKFLI